MLAILVPTVWIIGGGAVWADAATKAGVRPVSVVGVHVSAHRGGAQQWPQDSLLAYRNSLQAGYDEMEGDAWVTTDGVTVIEHDNAISPTRCTGPFVGQDIWTLTAAQVATVRCEGQPIPTEAQLLDLVAHSVNQHTVLRLETKSFPGQSDASARAWAAQVGGQVVVAGLAHRVIMQDFDWAGIAGYHDASASLRVSALVVTPTTAAAAQAKALGAYDLSYAAAGSTPIMNAYIASLGLVPTVWGIDAVPAESGPLLPAQATLAVQNFRRAVAQGAKVVITNNPTLITAARGTPFTCSVSYHAVTPRTITLSSRSGPRSYFHALSQTTTDPAAETVRVSVLLARPVRGEKVQFTSEGFSSASGLTTTLAPSPAESHFVVNINTGNYGGIRIMTASTPTYPMTVTGVGYYARTCA